MSVETRSCEECRGFGSGTHPNGSPWDCDNCDGEGLVCAECGHVECIGEGECIGEELRRREERQRQEYETRRKEARELAARRVIALDAGIRSLRLTSGPDAPNGWIATLEGLRDELEKAAQPDEADEPDDA